MSDTVIPSPTVTPAEAPTNSGASTEDINNYVICDRTGFRVRPGELRQEWNGLMVRRESWEPRNTQDMVRAKPEIYAGSIRPEQDDTFIDILYPNGVTPDDL